MGKVLISFFSASGITKQVANQIAEILAGDTFEIEPVIPYTSADLDWTNKNSRSSIEMADRSSRPKIVNKVDNLDDYETVLIGFPIWWDVAPTIINTFVEENDLTNKKIYIFVTSGGSSVINSLNDLKNTYANLNIINGMRFSPNVTKDEVEKLVV